MQRLFSVPKVGLFLDGFSPATEKRRDGQVKIIKASFRLQPFDAKLAGAIDEGLSDNSGVRAALFKLNNPEPKPHIGRLNFSLSCPRQNMEIFASPDTIDSRILFPQVKIGGVYARTQKDIAGYAFCFSGSFGAVDRDTLEFLQHWYQNQMFVSFMESEPSLEFSTTEAEDDENDNDAPPMPTIFDDHDDEEAEKAGSANVAAAKESSTNRRREVGHRYPKKKAKAAKRGKARR